MTTPTPKKLTPKQRLFVAAYASNRGNATKAAITAGYSAKTAYSIGSENLKKPEIIAAIDALFDGRTMGPKEVLARLSEQGRADIVDIVDADGQVNLKKARARGKTNLIKSVTHTTVEIRGVKTTTIKVDLHDSQKALQLLGKYHKLFVERVQVDDWRSQAIQDIKAGVVDYETLKEALGEEETRQLFGAAGVPIVIGDGDDSAPISG